MHFGPLVQQGELTGSLGTRAPTLVYVYTPLSYLWALRVAQLEMKLEMYCAPQLSNSFRHRPPNTFLIDRDDNRDVTYIGEPASTGRRRRTWNSVAHCKTSKMPTFQEHKAWVRTEIYLTDETRRGVQ